MLSITVSNFDYQKLLGLGMHGLEPVGPRKISNQVNDRRRIRSFWTELSVDPFFGRLINKTEVI